MARPAPRRRGGAKPLDVGTGVVCASFGNGGRWLSVGAPHPQAGFIELNALPSFDEAARRRPDLVRRYRGLLAQDEHAFLAISPLPAEPPLAASERVLDRGLRHERRYAGWQHRCTTIVRAGQRSLRQRHVLRADEGAAHPAQLVAVLRGRLDRPALAEITEVAPLPPTGAATAFVADGHRLRVRAALLGAELTVEVEADSVVAWRVDEGEARLIIPWPSAQAEVRFAVVCALEVGGQ